MQEQEEEQEKKKEGAKGFLAFSIARLDFLACSWGFKVSSSNFQFYLEAIMTLKHANMSYEMVYGDFMVYKHDNQVKAKHGT